MLKEILTMYHNPKNDLFTSISKQAHKPPLEFSAQFSAPLARANLLSKAK